MLQSAAAPSPFTRGQSALERLRAARHEDLSEMLQGRSPEEHPELAARLQTLARDLIDEDAQRLRDDERLRTAA